jgi:hypothetical protein
MRHGALRYGRAAIVAVKLPHLDKEVICRETASSLLPFFHLRSFPHHRHDLCLLQTQAVDQFHFRTDGSVHWDTHLHGVGWTIAGAGATVIRAYPLAVDKEAITSTRLLPSRISFCSVMESIHN